MPQTLDEVPSKIDLSSGIVKKPTAKPPTPSKLDLSAGIVKQTGAAIKGKAKSSGLGNAADKAFTGIVSPETATKVTTLGLPIPSSQEYAKQAAEAKAQGKPYAAALDDLEGYAAAGERAAGGFLSSLTSPAQLGLMAATAGSDVLEQGGYNLLSKVARVPGWAATIGFGAQGAKIAATPQQPGETKYDAMWRQLMGSAAFVGSTEAAWSGIKATFSNVLKRQFGLNDDLASKVSEQVQKIDQARKQTATAVAATDAKTQQEISTVQKGLQEDLNEVQGNTSTRTRAIRANAEKTIEQGKGKLTDLQAQRLRTGASAVADTMQALVQEHERAQKPFQEIAAKIKGPVTDETSVRSVIDNAFKDKGVELTEVPKSAVQLLKGAEKEDPTITIMGEKVKISDLSARQREQLGDVLPTDEAGGVGFDKLTRIREDLRQAATSAKDGRIKSALFKAEEDVTNLQEKVAKDKGLGKEYQAAKNQYKVFRRGIGSEMVDNWLNASDAEAQAVTPKIAELTTRQNASALRTVLKAAGVDVKPLDDVIAQMGETGKQIKETAKGAKSEIAETEKGGTATSRLLKSQAKGAVSEATKTGEEAKAAAEKQGKEQIGEATKEPVIHGTDVEKLASKSNKELLALRMRQQMNNAHTSGFANTWAMTSIIYGLMRIAEGSSYGVPMVGVGALRMELPRLMRQKSFQDWMIRQSGTEPSTPQGARMRKGLIAVIPVLDKALKTGVPQAAAVGAANSLGEVPNR